MSAVGPSKRTSPFTVDTSRLAAFELVIDTSPFTVSVTTSPDTPVTVIESLTVVACTLPEAPSTLISPSIERSVTAPEPPFRVTSPPTVSTFTSALVPSMFAAM